MTQKEMTKFIQIKEREAFERMSMAQGRVAQLRCNKDATKKQIKNAIEVCEKRTTEWTFIDTMMVEMNIKSLRY